MPTKHGLYWIAITIINFLNSIVDLHLTAFSSMPFSSIRLWICFHNISLLPASLVLLCLPRSLLHLPLTHTYSTRTSLFLPDWPFGSSLLFVLSAPLLRQDGKE